MAFQTFDPPGADKSDISHRIARLRAQFDALEIDGVVIPHEDEYQSEYLPPSEERLAFISGFTGSAGRAIILRDAALFATDGRYTLQAASQVPEDYTVVSDETAAKAWIEGNLKDVRLGVDPRLHSRKALEVFGRHATLVRLAEHPVDAIWEDRPAPPAGAVRAHPQALAGRSVADKISAVREAMSADAVLVAASDAVSWLLNWRGSDVAHTPLVLSRAFVPKEGRATVFVDRQKLTNALIGELEGIAEIAAPDAFVCELTRLAEGKTVQADPALTPDAALAAIEASGTLVDKPDPVARLKAVKNEAEIAGMRAAHQRDGVAMVRFLAWFDDHAAGRSEIDLVERLEAFRREAGALDISFDTIAGSGPNGAIVHYRVDRASNRTVGPDDTVLMDSGAQYPDGTTDITRTLCAGTASDTFKVQFTRVLKGHIALARQKFPVGTNGAALDTLARAALWQAGFDFAHGTGHGVGAALSVHEGPASISKRGSVALEAGMILSNEPGDYRADAFGIRIENLVLVRPAKTPPGGAVPMLSFETLTLAPIDTRLVVPSLLTPAEIGWLDAYHARVRGSLSGDLDAAARSWLAERTRPLA